MHYLQGVLSYELLIDSVIVFSSWVGEGGGVEKNGDANFRRDI